MYPILSHPKSIIFCFFLYVWDKLLIMNFQILLYYKYVTISDPEALKKAQRELCERLNLKGRIIIAHEGINGTVGGTKEETEAYIKEMVADPRFADIHWKKSEGTGNAFPKLSVKVRDEIVSLHLGEQDIDPNVVTGKYLTPEELHEWIHGSEKREFYIIDMRNTYEHAVGHLLYSRFWHKFLKDIGKVSTEEPFKKW
jgi:UPF0176 protein